MDLHQKQATGFPSNNPWLPLWAPKWNWAGVDQLEIETQLRFGRKPPARSGPCLLGPQSWFRASEDAAWPTLRGNQRGPSQRKVTCDLELSAGRGGASPERTAWALPPLLLLLHDPPFLSLFLAQKVI